MGIEVLGGNKVFIALLYAGIKGNRVRSINGGWIVTVYNITELNIVAKVCVELGIIEKV